MEEIKIKYGIKHTNGIIEAVSRFEGELGEGFLEITKEKYDQFLQILKTNSFVAYHISTNEIIIDESAQSKFNDAQRKLEIRHRLRALSGELDLMVRLNEETAEKQSEFDSLVAEYQGEPPQ